MVRSWQGLLAIYHGSWQAYHVFDRWAAVFESDLLRRVLFATLSTESLTSLFSVRYLQLSICYLGNFKITFPKIVRKFEPLESSFQCISKQSCFIYPSWSNGHRTCDFYCDCGSVPWVVGFWQVVRACAGV